jgi:RimJ/RimL family protein N-acetyltransferase
MKLKVLSYNDVEQVRQWRNDCIAMLRTSYLLTQEQQGKFYQDVVCKPEIAMARYWGIWEFIEQPNMIYEPQLDKVDISKLNPNTFIGQGEITNISLENRNGEIGLIMHPEHWGKAEKAVEMILEQAFNHLNLENLFGECYLCSPYIEFWRGIANKYEASITNLANRKYWKGEYYHSLYFSICREAWRKSEKWNGKYPDANY